MNAAAANLNPVVDVVVTAKDSAGRVLVQKATTLIGSTGGGTTVVYAPGQCSITGAPGGLMYAYPGGPVTGQFVSGGKFEAKQRTVYNSMDWYMIQPEAAMGNPPSWVPVSSLTAVGSGCS